jgi:hypothetical protein
MHAIKSRSREFSGDLKQNGVGHDAHGRAKSIIVSDPIFPTM